MSVLKKLKKGKDKKKGKGKGKEKGKQKSLVKNMEDLTLEERDMTLDWRKYTLLTTLGES